MIATIGKFLQTATSLSTSDSRDGRPVGLAGELRMSRPRLGVISFQGLFGGKRKTFSSRTGTGTGLAPVYSIIER